MTDPHDHNGRPAPPPPILDPSGRPARRPATKICPACGAGPEKRVRSGGFGPAVHDVCNVCGYDFQELTV